MIMPTRSSEGMKNTTNIAPPITSSLQCKALAQIQSTICSRLFTQQLNTSDMVRAQPEWMILTDPNDHAQVKAKLVKNSEGQQHAKKQRPSRGRQ